MQMCVTEEIKALLKQRLWVVRLALIGYLQYRLQLVAVSWLAVQFCLSCTRTSLFLGDAVRALIVGFSHFFFLAAVVLGLPKRRFKSAAMRVSNSSS